MGERTTAQQFFIGIGFFFLIAGTPAPTLSQLSPLPSTSPSEQVTHELSPQQSTSATAAGQLSKPSRTASFLAPVWFDARSPTWAYGYFARLTLGDFPAGLEVYDRSGKLISQTYVSIPGATQLWLVGAIPTSEGGAIGSGQLSSDEETTYFLAQTSLSGGVVSTVHTESFLAARMCTTDDGTVWTLGRDTIKESESDGDYAIVRQYSFEKGLLHSYLPRSSVDLQHDGSSGGGEGPSSTFLVCGKDRISVYLNQTNEYFEIDPSKETLKRWKMNMAPLPEGRVTGLAVTTTGRVFASLFQIKDGTDTKTHGLFELRTDPNAPTGKWILINGTLNSQPRIEDAPKGSFFRLWGADSEELAIRRLFGADMSWQRVVP